jgi:hypothetical protein
MRVSQMDDRMSVVVYSAKPGVKPIEFQAITGPAHEVALSSRVKSTKFFQSIEVINNQHIASPFVVWGLPVESFGFGMALFCLLPAGADKELEDLLKKADYELWKIHKKWNGYPVRRGGILHGTSKINLVNKEKLAEYGII